MPSTTDRALSTPLKVLLYGLLGVVSLIVVLTVVSFVFELVWGLIGLLFGIVSLAATIGVFVALGYAVYWLASRVLSGDDETASATDVAQTRGTDAAGVTGSDGTDPVERLSERYANGEITEAELERRLERVLDDPSTDDDTAEFDLERELN
jgi:uncharacterized membrane protein